MSVYLCGELHASEFEAWLKALSCALPGERIVTAPGDTAGLRDIDVALVANPASGSLKGLPGLRLVQSLWAGVDRLLADPTIPLDVPLARMVDPSMTAAMAETALWAVLSIHRGFFAYSAQQRQRRWRVLPQRRADEVQVAVLGWGQLGRAVGLRLAGQGYAVRGWRTGGARGPSEESEAVSVVNGPQALLPTLAQADIVVNLLPLTPATQGLFDRHRLAAMRPGAALVNLARGAHVVETDLLAALDSGHLAHAVLDVFQAEPLSNDHPFWAHSNVTVLPHAAALTDPRSAAEVAAANVRALRAGQSLAHLVDRVRGY